MAERKKSSNKSANTTKVTRISATDSQSKAAKATSSKSKASAKAKMVKGKTTAKSAGSKLPKSTQQVAERSKTNPLVAIAGYFKGAWFELTQVRWPNRRTTWGLTAAVILFSAFFVVLVVLLDTLFGKLFNLLIG